MSLQKIGLEHFFTNYFTEKQVDVVVKRLGLP